ncbi:MAG: DUF6265 family protein [Planctomycetota bacterium]
MHRRLRWTGAAIGALTVTTVALESTLAARAEHRAEATNAPTLSDFDWLEGHWLADLGNGVTAEEYWSAPVAGSVMGMYRQMKDDQTTLYELVTIEHTDDPDHPGPTLHIRHFNPGLVPWASEKDGPLVCPCREVEPDRAVFGAPERTGIRSFLYERDDDRLTVTISFSDEQQSPWIIAFQRAPK